MGRFYRSCFTSRIPTSTITPLFLTPALLLLILLSLPLVGTGCRGSSDGGVVVTPEQPGQTSPTTIAVSSGGSVSYSGSGAYSGLQIEAVGLPGDSRIRIERDQYPVAVGEYTPVGNLYTLTLLNSAGSEISGTGTITLTVPYSTTVVNQMGIDHQDLLLLRNGSPLGGTVTEARGTVTAALAGFSQFMVAFRDQPTVRDHPLPLIDFAWDGYAPAAKINDPSGKAIADPRRGLPVVQVGERVGLQSRRLHGSDQPGYDVSGYPYQSFRWELVSRPTGAAVVAPGSQSTFEFIPDLVGRYEISLTATRVSGVEDQEQIAITVGSYSLVEISGTRRNYCLFCHSGSMDGTLFGYLQDIYGRFILRDLAGPWGGTTHASGFNNLPAVERDNTTCLNCHTTGFHRGDDLRGGEAWGYDDFISDWNNPAAAPAPHLQGVTCEACHGPGGSGGGPPGSGLQHLYQASLAQGPCMACHNIVEGEIAGRPYFYNWEGDLHAQAHRVGNGRVADTDPCYHCHVGQYFIGRMAGKTLGPDQIQRPEGVTCAVCHDPHGESGHPKQLRIVGRISIPLQDELTNSPFQHQVEAGKAAVCYSCHNAYITLPAVGSDLHGNQAEMMEGFGGHTYGTMITGKSHGGRVVGDKCIDCHMVAEHGGQEVTTHQRRLYKGEDLFSAVDFTTTGCATAQCHQGPYALPTSGNRFDYQNRMSQTRDDLAALQAQINRVAGRAADATIIHNYAGSLSGTRLEAVNRAAYNYLFVIRDGSYGIHNYPYAAELLRLSTEDLAGNQ